MIDNRQQATLGGGAAAIEKHHAKGSYTARERINMLLDEGSFEEVNMFLTHRCHDFGMEKKVFLGDGVAVGSGTIDGRLVFVFAQDGVLEPIQNDIVGLAEAFPFHIQVGVHFHGDKAFFGVSLFPIQ